MSPNNEINELNCVKERVAAATARAYESRQGNQRHGDLDCAVMFAARWIAMIVAQPAAARGNVAPQSRFLGDCAANRFDGCDRVRDAALARAAAATAQRRRNSYRARDHNNGWRATATASATNSTRAQRRNFSRMSTDTARRLVTGNERADFLRPAATEKAGHFCAFYEFVLPGKDEWPTIKTH